MGTLSPELRALILNSGAMNDEEKGYWIEIVPSITDDQTARLFEILENERIKLEELNNEEARIRNLYL